MLTEAYILDDSIYITQNQPKLFYAVRSQSIGYPLDKRVKESGVTGRGRNETSGVLVIKSRNNNYVSL